MNDPYSDLEKSRKPRVHIKYEVESDGAMQEKELPFTVGVIGDYAGKNPGIELLPLKNREFIQIDKDNFDEVMKKIKPGVKLKIPLSYDDNETLSPVNLQFNSMDDFEPEGIINQVPELLYLQSVRNQLRELLAKSDSIDGLESLLIDVLRNPARLDELANKLAISSQQAQEENEYENR